MCAIESPDVTGDLFYTCNGNKIMEYSVLFSVTTAFLSIAVTTSPADTITFLLEI